MENEEKHTDANFSIKLSFYNIQVFDEVGNPLESVELNVSEPTLPIREQINRIVNTFKIPKTTDFGPIDYSLGQRIEDTEEYRILEKEDDNRREMCLLDYDIKTGDELHLINDPQGA